MSYERLSEQEQYWREQVDKLLRYACEVDEEERRQQQRCHELSLKLAQAQSRLKRLGQAKRELEQEALQKQEKVKREWSSRGKRGRPRK